MSNEHVVMLSGGVSSWATGKRVAEYHGTKRLTMLFADTKREDEDTYRFLHDASQSIGGTLVRIEEGRDVWQVFHDEGMIGNTRADLCSRILKRDLMRKWLEDNRDPANTRVYIGFDWTEQERINRSVRFWNPWQVRFPLAQRPFLWKGEIIDWCRREGIDPPALTRDGFAHANCGGACVKAGQVQWRHLLLTRPETYAQWETEEEKFRAEKGKDVAILRDRSGGTTTPLPLRVFRQRMEQGQECDMFDSGGCGCMDPAADVATTGGSPRTGNEDEGQAEGSSTVPSLSPPWWDSLIQKHPSAKETTPPEEK